MTNWKQEANVTEQGNLRTPNGKLVTGVLLTESLAVIALFIAIGSLAVGYMISMASGGTEIIIPTSAVIAMKVASTIAMLLGALSLYSRFKASRELKMLGFANAQDYVNAMKG